MAHKKAAGKLNIQTRTPGKRLGLKVAHGESVNTGEILIRQRGTKFRPGSNVKVAKDHTLYSVTSGVVHLGKKLGRSHISVIPS